MKKKKQDNKLNNNIDMMEIIPVDGVTKEAKERLEIVQAPVIMVDLKRKFKSPDVQRILNIKKERIRQWLKLGYIKPSIKASTGPGTDNIFSGMDLLNISLFKKLTDFGLNRWISSQYILKMKIGKWNKIIYGEAKYLLVLGNIDRKKQLDKTVTIELVKYLPHSIDDYDIAFAVNLLTLIKKVNEIKVDIYAE
jgi:hypothetical protein